MVGPGVAPGVSDDAGEHAPGLPHDPRLGGPRAPRTACAAPTPEVVLGEAMKPFLAVRLAAAGDGGRGPARRRSSPGSARGLRRRRRSRRGARPRPRRATLPRAAAHGAARVPGPVAGAPRAPRTRLDEEARRKLASLGYVSAGAAPVVRKDAPRPADMVRLFDVLEQASGLFVRERVRARPSRCSSRSWPRIPATSTPRCAWRPRTRRSATTRRRCAAFEKARRDRAAARRTSAPTSRCTTRAGSDWAARGAAARAGRRRDRPSACPALEALARVRERQGRVDGGARAAPAGSTRCATPSAAELVRLGRAGDGRAGRPTSPSSRSSARAPLRATAFAHDLELGVLYLAARRFAEARAALDRVPPSHPGYPMALFKRAQVSVLLERAGPGGAHRGRAAAAPTRRRAR